MLKQPLKTEVLNACGLRSKLRSPEFEDFVRKQDIVCVKPMSHCPTQLNSTQLNLTVLYRRLMWHVLRLESRCVALRLGSSASFQHVESWIVASASVGARRLMWQGPRRYKTAVLSTSQSENDFKSCAISIIMADVWMTEAQEKLIEMWRDRPALYQVDAKIFSNRLDKSAAMRELVAELGTSGKLEKYENIFDPGQIYCVL